MDIHETLQGFFGLSVALFIAACLGLIAGLVIRHFGLRWTWAPTIGLPLTLLASSAGFRPGFFIGAVTAAATFTTVARTWYHCERGGAERQRERRRLGVLAFLARVGERRRRYSDRVQGERLALGETAERKVAEVPFGATRGVHGLLVGATDGGKTTTARSICQAHARVGNAVIAIDGKGDRDLEETLREAAARTGVPFYLWTPRGPCAYNVARRGGASEVADKLLSAHQWSEPHYLSIALRYVQREVEVLRTCDVEPSLASIAHYMHPERLGKLAADAGEETLVRVETLTDDLPKRMLDELAGARSRVALLAEAEFGAWLNPSQNGTAEIELADVVRREGVAYFRLEADRHPELGGLLAAALVVDLVTLSADLQGGEQRGLVFIDEFAALGADQVSRLFATARSAGLSVLLATQGLADMRAARLDGGADTLTAQVIQNVAYVIAHRISDPEAAQALAETAGTYETWTLTQEVGGDWLQRTTGSGSRIPTHEFRVHPNQFKSLRRGEAVVIENGRGVEVVRVWEPLGGLL